MDVTHVHCTYLDPSGLVIVSDLYILFFVHFVRFD
jgi:hypothetical protein